MTSEIGLMLAERIFRALYSSAGCSIGIGKAWFRQQHQQAVVMPATADEMNGKKAHPTQPLYTENIRNSAEKCRAAREYTINGKAKTFYAFILELGASVFAVFIFLTLIFFITAFCLIFTFFLFLLLLLCRHLLLSFALPSSVVWWWGARIHIANGYLLGWRAIAGVLV